jgi:acetolactate decarboxylase
MVLSTVRINYLLIIICVPLGTGCSEKEPPVTVVHTAGAMRNVMQRGELLGTISIDTISNKEHLFGLGPLENLAGEILVTDGFAYQSKVVNDTTLKVEETLAIKAPFFVYMNVDEWNEVIIPDSILSLQQLESFLDQFSESVEDPFAFRLMGFV